MAARKRSDASTKCTWRLTSCSLNAATTWGVEGSPLEQLGPGLLQREMKLVLGQPHHDRVVERHRGAVPGRLPRTREEGKMHSEGANLENLALLEERRVQGVANAAHSFLLTEERHAVAHLPRSVGLQLAGSPHENGVFEEIVSVVHRLAFFARNPERSNC